jgi:hypothetical protein
VTEISHEGLRGLLREESVRFQAVRSWKRSNDPDFVSKRDCIVELYALADAPAEHASELPAPRDDRRAPRSAADEPSA